MDQNKQVMNEMWLDYEGQPIKWQHPIGLSWDLFGTNYELPWRLILHFSEFPAKDITRCNTKSQIEANFMSSIKEADALKHKGIVIQNMVKKDHNQLWSSLINDKFDQFWSVNSRLMERIDSEAFRYIPFRLYLPDYTYIQKLIRPCTTDKQIFHILDRSKLQANTDKTTSCESPSSTTTAMVTPSIPSPYNRDMVSANKTHKCNHDLSGGQHHRCTTMMDLIRVCFTNRMSDLLVSSCKKKEPENQEKDLDSEMGAGCEKTLEDAQDDETKHENDEVEDEGLSNLKLTDECDTDEIIDANLFKYRFLSHGVEIPFDTPLQWLSEHFSYPDNFLHICAKLKENSSC